MNSVQSVKKALYATTLGGAISLIAAGVSHAQVTTSSPANKPYAFKIGVFVPSGKDVRRSADDLNLALDADIRLQVLPGSNSVALFNIGYIRGNDDFQMVPITLSQVFRDPNSGAGGYYYGYGLGIYATKLNAPDTSGKTKGLLGGFVVAGIEGRGPLFGELKYHYISKYDDKFVGGFQATVGIRL
ncbi:MAG: hypothetical protein H7Z41_07405 [Cytophagales bacterium]|nr:hypothetical protein [Armatimonadota bacterium]